MPCYIETYTHLQAILKIPALFVLFQASANLDCLLFWKTTHHPETLCSDKVMLSLHSLLILPHPPICIALPDFPYGYTESLCHSMAILTAIQTFPTFNFQTLYDCHLLYAEDPDNRLFHLLHYRY
ncbi:MAG: hypothetical protein SCARUB_02667 [Candidatus Scalindua rubra]|uniref:Uncharacterized protein n=1 Tax=Candidatus Scalindua rubra TaxID=1872076 RepID=A0A1E3X9C5_9BACT|nr:MAG: hypothetical protein SCARUB_02667 [Candidatus Scalindua rubra]